MTLFNADIKIYTSNNKIYTNTNARVEKMEKSSAASAKKEKKPERKKITKADVGGEKAFCILPHRVREGEEKKTFLTSSLKRLLCLQYQGYLGSGDALLFLFVA